MTQTTKHYNSAPIVEAVIDLRIQPGASLDLKALHRLADLLKPKFPIQAPMYFMEMGIEGQQDRILQSKVNQSIVGIRLSKPDNSRIFQVRTDTFSYSHLAPYSDWATFSNEAKMFWKAYRGACPEAKLTRCAVRYINRILIPALRFEIEDYFELYPKIASGLPQKDVALFGMNVQMPQQDLQCMANINLSIGDQVKQDHVSIFLDVDVFRLQIESWDDNQTWEYLEKLRDRKNDIFEACITNRTRELIDK